MTMTTQYSNWTVTPRYSGGLAVVIGGTGCHYRLDSSSPVRGTGPTRQPYDVDAPTMAPRMVRRRIPGGPSTGVVRQPLRITHISTPRPQTRFGLTFIGAGAGPGIDIGVGISSPGNPSSTGTLHFFGPSRCAQDFSEEGFILEGSISDYTLSTAGFQVLVLEYPVTMLGGVSQLVRRIERGFSTSGGGNPITMLREILGIRCAITAVAGTGEGFSVGLTLFIGRFIVTETSL